MKITYSIWQGSQLKGIGFTASSIKDVVKTIEELNSVKPQIKFSYFISKLEQEQN